MADALGLTGSARQAFIEAAHVAHSTDQLVTDFRQRGQQIDKLRDLLADIERYLTVPAETTEAAKEEADVRKYTREQAVERLIKCLRFNRKIFNRLNKDDRKWLLSEERDRGRA